MSDLIEVPEEFRKEIALKHPHGLSMTTEEALNPDVERIHNFYQRNWVNINASCPLCGASIQWTYRDSENLMLHIAWHQRMSFWEAADEE